MPIIVHGQTLTQIGLRADSSRDTMHGVRKPGSHVKVFLPYLPYIATSHSINAGLVRPANNEKGWEYDLAVAHRRVADNIYEFDLRQGVKFQDGTEFDADAVLLNMSYFKRQPYTFTRIDSVYGHTEKISKYRVRFHLKEKYGLFIYDAIWIHFYTKIYLEKYGWNGKATCPNLAAPGPYGIGPYTLTQGYIEGDRNSSVAQLVANEYYWDKNVPKVEKITVYMDLDTDTAITNILSDEGKLDVMPIPFSEELPTVLSPFAKLIRSPSSNNYSVHINLVSGHPLLKERKVREAINSAIDQESLLMLSMNGEGEYSPTMISPRFYGVKEASQELKPHSLIQSPLQAHVREELIALIKHYQQKYGLDPTKKLQLTLLAQESFLYLITDIKYLLEQIHIELKIKLVNEEKDVFSQLFRTISKTNNIDYDMLIWGNYDWFRHPWTAFLVYRPNSVWSTIGQDELLEGYIETLFKTAIDETSYIPLLKKIIHHVYHQSYMLFLPSPNKVLALNKEVYYPPRTSAFIPLWEIEVSDNHWSIRQGDYPEKLKTPVDTLSSNLNSFNMNQGEN
ncbi:extracellular solute-binding protein, family 5 [Shewanella psychrophila]|uniref:Extracellular solute-binding protein, family 5 n=1 Tax=Shewanella psychrophila TaxID=225848 RepID=A0A1S6HR38_9GAMM|nr:ABC transporter substrate-binding protein [Shewanella psychrophila]AQS38017.1 extracellular solute-binding protein, family 5 [Shewanella psychrophila]